MMTSKKYDTLLELQRTEAEYIVSRTLDVESLQSLQNLFSGTTGMACVITGPDGNFITKPSWGNVPARRDDMGWQKRIPVTVNSVQIAYWLLSSETGQKGADEKLNNEAVMLLRHIIRTIEEAATFKLRHEIGQQDKHQMALQQQIIKERYHKIIAHIDEAVMIFNRNYDIVAANSRAFTIYRLDTNSLSDLNRRRKELILVDEERNRVAPPDLPVNYILSTKENINNKVYGLKDELNDDIIWLQLNGAPLRYSNNRVDEVFISFQDITLKKQKTDTLIESIREIENLQEPALLGTYTANLTDKKWYSSRLHQKILGLYSDQLLNHETWVNLIHPDWKEEVESYFSQNTGEHYNCIYKIIQPNSGEEKWIRDIGRRIEDKQLNVKMAVGTVQDITDLKLAEEKAILNEEKYRRIFSNVLDIYYKLTADFTLVEISPSVSRLTQSPIDELIGRNVTDFLYDQEQLYAMQKVMDERGDLNDYHITLRAPENKILYVSVSAHIVFDKDRSILYYEGFVRDITYRKQIEKQLLESESRLRSYFENAPTIIAITDAGSKIIDINPANLAVTGYTKEEIMQMDYRDVISPESLADISGYGQQLKETGNLIGEMTIICKNRERKHLHVVSTVLPNHQVIHFGLDITPRKAMEVTILQNKQILEEAQQIAKVGHGLIDFMTNTWESSSMFDKLTGITADFEKNNRNWAQLIHPDDIIELRAFFLKDPANIPSKIEQEVRIIRFDNQEVRWFKALGKVIWSDSGEMIKLRFTIQDITHEKEMNEKLKAKEILYRTTLNASPDIIVVVDLEHRIKMVSPSALKLFGHENLQNIKGRSILDFVAKEDVRKAKKRLLTVQKQSKESSEYRMQKQNGETFMAELNWDYIKDDDQTTTGMIIILRDVTDKKIVQQKLIESERQLKSIGLRLQKVREDEKTALAREIHDDLGQILVVTKIELGMLKRQLLEKNNNDTSDPVVAKISDIIELNNNTLHTARRIMDELRTDELELLGLIETAQKLVNSFEKRNCLPVVFNEPDTHPVLNTNQSVALYRILQEALSNISKYANASEVEVNFQLGPDYFEMSVTDDGCGFDTGSKHRNNAYGLRGIRERILLLGGTVNINSTIGEGTSIRVQIPYKATAG